MTLANKIVVLRGGVVEQVGGPMELYETPRNMFVAQFIGSPKMNFFEPAELLPEQAGAFAEGDAVGVRPEHLKLADGADGIVKGRLELVEQLGEYALAHMTMEHGTEFIAKLERPPEAPAGSELQFSAELERVHVFDRETGARKA